MPTNRQDRIQYANRVIARDPYISKRQLQKAVKGKFGIGLSDTSRRDLIRPAKRVEFTRRARQIEAKVVKPRLKTKRQDRYDYLKKNGFDHGEALRFSRIRNAKKNFAIKEMIEQRQELLARFIEKAGVCGWGISKQRREWANTISRWYERNHLVTKKGKASPWDWYNKASDSLPPELQDEYPRPHSRKRQDLPTIKKIDRSRWIHNLRDLIERDYLSANPNAKRRAEWRRQIKLHQEALKGR